MKPRHIIMVSSYYPPHLGGQENAVQDLAKQLVLAGHQVEVLTSTRGGGTKGIQVEDGVRVHRLPSFVFGHAPIMPGFLTRLLQVARPGSIVHLHIGQAFTPEMVWLAARLRRFAYVAQLHIDFEPSGPAGWLLPLYKRALLRPVLRAAAAVIVLNPETLRTVRSAYNFQGNAVIMNNNIDESYFELHRMPWASTPPKVLKLLFVGRLSKQKNLLALVGALTLVDRPVHLDIVGEGDQQVVVQAAAVAAGLKNVTWHGRLGRQEVMELYQTCDALVLPSLYEAQPLVLLESMAARIPVIGTNVIGVGSQLKDAGIIVEPSAVGLAEGIRRYDVIYSQLPRMVQLGYDRVQPLRSTRNRKKYEALYGSVLGS